MSELNGTSVKGAGGLQLDETFANAMESIKAEARSKEAAGYAVMAAMMSTSGGSFAKASHAAKLFCIAFAFLSPCLLFARYALN